MSASSVRRMPAATVFLSELLGTAFLVLLGTGVVANVQLRRTTGHGGDWLLISIGWGFAVFVGASVADASGAHINPAVTIGLAVAGDVSWTLVPIYLLGEVTGAVLGAVLCWLAYKKQFDTHDDPGGTLTVFATAPTVLSPLWNVVTEVIGTYVLVLWILLNPGAGAGADGIPSFGNAALGYAGVAFVVISIGASLGGPTGYAINPARDLGPRLAYSLLLPIRGKGGGDWGYAWVPITGPLIGAALAGASALALPFP